MNCNDVLRRFRYALDIKDSDMLKSFENSGIVMEKDDMKNLLRKDDEDGFVECSDKQLEAFFDGFIILKRGVKGESK